MIKTAVLLTVFNRRDITLQGLLSLYQAIEYLGGDYHFDIYMTDDGCTDGTDDAVRREFPEVRIIQGDGKLYWSGGMRKAWQSAINSGIDYDFYLWFNDDAMLYEKSLHTMFQSYNMSGENTIISGAFCDSNGFPSYGGRDKKNKLLEPQGTLQKIFLMNGNIVLVPRIIVKDIGIIDDAFTHSFGDWDFGCRAIKKGYTVLLTHRYVGVTNRHDNDMEPFLDDRYNFTQRIKMLYSEKYSAKKSFLFCKRHLGLIKAIRVFFLQNIYAISPHIYKMRLCIK